MFPLLTEYWPALLSGAGTTLILASCSWIGGIALGLPTGFVLAENRLMLRLFDGVSFAVSTVPVLVLLFWLHYPVQAMTGVVVDPRATSIAAFILLNAIQVATVVARASHEVAGAYREAAFVSGMSHEDMRRFVEIPLVLRATLPQIISFQVVVLHMTLFASLISVDELFRTAQRINAVEYKPVEVYSLLVLFYAAISAPLLLASMWWARRNRTEL